tara:strand:+ start:3087 stop:4484 length:1398 start_codon:yes stop_codon:yes gene_type:complete
MSKSVAYYFSKVIFFLFFSIAISSKAQFVQSNNLILEYYSGLTSSDLWKLNDNNEFLFPSVQNQYNTSYGSLINQSSRFNYSTSLFGISYCIKSWEDSNKPINRAFIIGLGYFNSFSDISVVESISGVSFNGNFSKSASSIWMKNEFIFLDKDKVNLYSFINPGIYYESYEYSSQNNNFYPYVDSLLNSEIKSDFEIRFGFGLRIKLDNRLGLDFAFSSRPYPYSWNNKNAILGTSYLFYGLNWVMGKNKRNYRSISEGENKYEKKYATEKIKYESLMRISVNESKKLVKEKNYLEKDLSNLKNQIEKLIDNETSQVDARTNPIIYNTNSSTKENSISSSKSLDNCEISEIKIVDPNNPDYYPPFGNGAQEVDLVDQELINYDYDGFEFLIHQLNTKEKNVKYEVIWRDGFTSESFTKINEITSTEKLIKIENLVDKYDKVIIDIYKYCGSKKSELFTFSVIPTY